MIKYTAHFAYDTITVFLALDLAGTEKEKGIEREGQRKAVTYLEETEDIPKNVLLASLCVSGV